MLLQAVMVMMMERQKGLFLLEQLAPKVLALQQARLHLLMLGLVLLVLHL
jgi:hypothetical protein